MSKKAKGRRKIDLVKIADKKSLQATFSRRRTGIFKKANELSVLSGVEIAIIVFSPGHKAYTFGHPNVHIVTESFLTRNPPLKSKFMAHVEDLRKANVKELTMQLAKVQNELEVEKEIEKEITEMMEARQKQQWWGKPIDQMDMPQLHELMTYLGGINKILCENTPGKM